MTKNLLLFILLYSTINITAQNVGVGVIPRDYAKLDIQSTTSGLQLPRMTTAQRSALKGNIEALSSALSEEYSGMLVYDTDTKVMSCGIRQNLQMVTG